MKVTVLGQGNLVEDTEADEIRSRIYFALSRFDPQLSHVTVQTKYVGETRKAPQYLCRLSVRMKQLGSFSVESIFQEKLNAVSWAADSAARRVQRFIDRNGDNR